MVPVGLTVGPLNLLVFVPLVPLGSPVRGSVTNISILSVSFGGGKEIHIPFCRYSSDLHIIEALVPDSFILSASSVVTLFVVVVGANVVGSTLL